MRGFPVLPLAMPKQDLSADVSWMGLALKGLVKGPCFHKMKIAVLKTNGLYIREAKTL